ncbi:MAG: ABC transporter permease [Gammaproteobacteria bacterium]
MNRLILSLRMLRREWYSGDLRVLSLALLIAVTSVTSVGFFTDRIRQALEQQAGELIGADLAISSSDQLSGEYIKSAKNHQLKVAESVEFPTMAISGDSSQLSALKAVGSGYPLRGDLYISDELFAADRIARKIPEKGTVWLESRLLTALQINVGDVVSLGDMNFRISAVLTQEPARAGGSIFGVAPRVLMNIKDLAQTKLVQPASRVKYGLLFSGLPENISNFRKILKGRLLAGERIESIEDARPEVQTALKRSRSFLGLAALISVLLAGIAIATATRHFVSKHMDSCAVMRCVGATQNDILLIYTCQLLTIALITASLGCLLGYLMQSLLIVILGSLVTITLPSPSYWPVFSGYLVCLVALTGFAMPPLLQLRHVSTLRVLRRELSTIEFSGLSIYGLGITAFVILVIWQTGEFRLAMVLVWSTAAVLLILLAVALLLIRMLRSMHQYAGVSFKLGMANIFRRGWSSVIQMMAFGLGLTVLLLLSLVRSDLLTEWESGLPDEAPNRFLINIQPEQLNKIKQFFDQEDLAVPELYPMVRARLIKINGEAVSVDTYDEDRAKRLVAREFNLSWAMDLQKDNEVTRGAWVMSRVHGNMFSVEEGLAETLEIHIGDELQFSIAGVDYSGTVNSLRLVNWDSFQVNFFVVASPGELETYPHSFITSFYLPKEQFQILNKLVRQFPNITVIDVDAIMGQVRLIIQRVTMAVEYVFVFTLLAGLLVMYAAIASTLEERIHEGAVLRTLGANRRQLREGQVAEFSLVGLLAGLVAALAASAMSYVLSEYIFHLPYSVNIWIWLVGVLTGVTGACVVGIFGTRQVVNLPPVVVIRSAG